MGKFIQSRNFKGFGIAIVLVVLTLGWLIHSQSRASNIIPDSPVVKTQVMSADGNETSYSYSGVVHGRFESQLAFQVSGKLIRRNVDAGSVVRTGNVLMQIDPIDVEQGVSADRAQLQAAESQFKLAKDNLDRFKALYDQKLMSQAEFDRYQNVYDSADALLRQARAQYTHGSNQLNYCNLYADGPGVIAGTYAETGQIVAAGQPVAVLVKGNEREIEINVPENRLIDFNKVQQFKVTFWALPDTALEGRIREVSPMADPVTRTYKVRISLVNPPAAIKLGMTATVSETASNGGLAIYLPLSAIYQAGDTPGIWLVRQGIVHWKPVQLGSFGDGDQVQVLKGLRAGDMIVTAGVHKLREGEKVRTGDDID
ncbi:MAG TPA: efflux transporter periplasmic adaptor subunit [Firmicutes bacterium]|nr:efflux transporter periplasmic adaptor subunit [Bacillota bacterium]